MKEKISFTHFQFFVVSDHINEKMFVKVYGTASYNATFEIWSGPTNRQFLNKAASYGRHYVADLMKLLPPRSGAHTPSDSEG